MHYLSNPSLTWRWRKVHGQVGRCVSAQPFLENQICQTDLPFFRSFHVSSFRISYLQYQNLRTNRFIRCLERLMRFPKSAHLFKWDVKCNHMIRYIPSVRAFYLSRVFRVAWIVLVKYHHKYNFNQRPQMQIERLHKVMSHYILKGINTL